MSEQAFNDWYDRYFDEAIEKYAGLDTTNPKGIAHDAWDAAIEADRKRQNRPVYEEGWKDALEWAERNRKRRGEPVMYQVRTRPDWNEHWFRWKECTREQAEGYRKAPVVHDLHYEVRELYTAPQPAEPVSQHPDETKAMSLDDAIAHAVEIAADGSTQCQRQHLQLAAWLRELREFRCASKQPSEPLMPGVEFDDPRVQQVYKIICGDNHPPEGEHWDGYVSRLIVDALFHDEPTFATPDCRDCGCVQDGQCLCNPSKPSAESVKVPLGYVLIAEDHLEAMIGPERMDHLRRSCRFPALQATAAQTRAD